MAAGKAYKAGTIFLQVAPVFGDFQREIDRKVREANKRLGQDMEQGGRDAGKAAGKGLGEEVAKAAEKSGDESGRIFGTRFQRQLTRTIKKVEKDLGNVVIGGDSSKIQKELRTVQAELKDLSKYRIFDDKSARSAHRWVRRIGSDLARIQKSGGVSLDLTPDLESAVKSVGDLDRAIQKAARSAKIRLDLDHSDADRNLGTFERAIKRMAAKAREAIGEGINPELDKIRSGLRDLEDVELRADVDVARARGKIALLRKDLEVLAMRDVNTQVNADTLAALASIKNFERQLDALDGKTADVNVRADTGKAAAEMGLFRALFRPGDGNAETAANSFRSFNAVILAATMLVPALIPLIGALGGALLALVPILAAAGAGLGAVILGFSGIGDAVKGLGDVQEEAAKDANAAAKTMRSASYAVVDARRALEDAERNAARAAEDAERRVAAARRSAADAIERAIKRQRDAQDRYRDSIKRVQEAEQDLREARKRAAQEERDTDFALRQNQVAQRQGVINLFDATNNYNATMADGGSTATEREQAGIDLEEARLNLERLRAEEKRLGEERRKQQKDGIEGNKAVRDANQDILDALARQAKAEEDLREAARETTRARMDGARDVADALRDQGRQEADSARAVARSQEMLRRANEAYAQALYDTGVQGSAAMQRLEDAMDKLGPAGQQFAYFIHSLRDDFYALRDAVQEAFLPAIERGMRRIIRTYGPQFTNFMAEMGAAMGLLFEKFAESLEGPAWSAFFKSMGELGALMATEFGMSMIYWLEGFVAILAVVAPFAEAFSKGMMNMAESFSAWASSERGMNAMTGFMQYAADIGPAVLSFIGAFFRALANLSKALAPWGEMVLTGLTNFLDYIANMDPSQLGVIAAALIGLTVAFQSAAGIVAGFYAGLAAIATPAGRFVLAFGVIATWVAILAIEFEGFRDLLKDVAGWIGDNADLLGKLAMAIGAAVAVWKTYQFILAVVRNLHLLNALATGASVTATHLQAAANVKAAATANLLSKAMKRIPLILIAMLVIGLVVALVKLYKENETVRAYMQAAWKVLLAVGRAAFNGIRAALRGLWKGLQWAWKNVFKPVFTAIGKVVKWLWQKIVKPYFTFIFKFWRQTFRGMRRVWNNILKPIIDLFAHLFVQLWKVKVKPNLDRIGNLFSAIGKGIQSVYNKWIRPAIRAFMRIIGDRLVKRFEGARDRIKSIWDSLKGIFAAPIRFMIETVVNKGIVGGFNKLAGWLGMDEAKHMKPLPVPKWAEKQRPEGGGGGSYATGGVLPGYTPGRDVHHFASPTGGYLNLSGGEAIMRPEFTAALGPNWVNRVNALARSGGVEAVRKLMLGERGFKNGGVVWPTTFRSLSPNYAGHTGVDISIPGSADLGKPVFAAMGGQARSLWGGSDSYGNYVRIAHPNGYETIYAHLQYPGLGGHGRARNVKAGEHIGAVGSTGNSSGPHLHFEVRPGGSHASALNFLSGAALPPPGEYSEGPDAGASWPKRLLKIASNPLGYIKGMITKPIKAMTERFGGSGIIETLTSVPRKLMTAMRDKVVDWLPGPLVTAAGGIKDGLGAVVGGAKKVGRGILNVGEGALDKIGIGGAGDVDYNGAMMYDSGGYLPPGLTTVLNMTGKPEPVFTADQFEGLGSAPGDTFHYEPHFYDSDLTAEEVAADMNFQMRSLQRRGKYRRG